MCRIPLLNQWSTSTLNVLEIDGSLSCKALQDWYALSIHDENVLRIEQWNPKMSHQLTIDWTGNSVICGRVLASLGSYSSGPGIDVRIKRIQVFNLQLAPPRKQIFMYGFLYFVPGVKRHVHEDVQRFADSCGILPLCFDLVCSSCGMNDPTPDAFEGKGAISHAPPGCHSVENRNNYHGHQPKVLVWSLEEVTSQCHISMIFQVQKRTMFKFHASAGFLFDKQIIHDMWWYAMICTFFFGVCVCRCMYRYT